VLDALTVTNPGAFDTIVQRIAQLVSPPTIKPLKLTVYAKTALVVKCENPDSALKRTRDALIDTTRHLLARAPVTDEEWQRAMWWVRKVGNRVRSNLAALELAREEYGKAGAPALPRTRHFRLSYLVHRVKEIRGAQDKKDKAKELRARKHLHHFLAFGEPHHYAGSGGLHTTIASGLDPRTSKRLLAQLSPSLWPEVERRLGRFEAPCLAIMGEDPENPVTVEFFDRLTETPVKERRPGFKVLSRAEFAAKE